MNNPNVAAKFPPELRPVRVWTLIFIVGLVLSGVTAFPLQTETAFLFQASQHFGIPQHVPALYAWLARVAAAVADTTRRYPFLAYGTDWLAFGHLVIATAFIGLYRDPIRNKWLVDFGLIACIGVIPLAVIAGGIRGIPVYWRAIDFSFGILGSVPLLMCRKHIRAAEERQRIHSTS